jgi:hypothetical protein
MCELKNGTINYYFNLNGILVPCVFFLVKNRPQVLDNFEKGAL